jgi:hypothetical protein
MTDAALPEPRVPDPDAPVRPAALVLPAVAEPPLDERRPWLERYEVTDAVAVPGTATPLYLIGSGIAGGAVVEGVVAADPLGIEPRD